MAQSSTNAVNLKVMDETHLEQSWGLLGAGAFGQVWKARHYQWGWNVAIKILGLDNGLHSNEDLVRETNFMQRAECPYVLRVMGVFRGCRPSTAVVVVGLVMELMERGSLTSMQRKLNHPLPWPLVFRLAHQVALGMNYLHRLTPALIHKDLKPDNILLDAYLNVKITDFGLTKFDNSVTLTRMKSFGTAPYAPPEASQGGATYAYDVYSYAMVLYSILHTGHIIPRINNSEGERPPLEYVKSMNAPGLEELVDLMVKCWNQTPDQRPTFAECIAETERLYEEHKSGINDAVYKVQNELDGVIVPVEGTSSGTNLNFVWSELKDLRDMVEKISSASKSADAKLQLQNGNMAEMRVDMRLESRNAKTELAEMRVELENEKDKMAEMRVELENEKDKIAEMRVDSRSTNIKLQLQKDKMAGVERENAVLISRLVAMEQKLEDDMPQIAEKPKVAFCAHLSGEVGPYGTDTPLIYKEVVTNIGQNYSPLTGLFTAPVKGVYYFRYTASHRQKGEWMGVKLYHDGQKILHNAEVGDGANFISNTLILQLEQGSVVSLRLPVSCRLRGTHNKSTTFSGFLLFST